LTPQTTCAVADANAPVREPPDDAQIVSGLHSVRSDFGGGIPPRFWRTTKRNSRAARDIPVLTRFPNGLLQPNGNSLGLLTGVGSQIDFIDQNRQSPYVQQYSIDGQGATSENTESI
jgi:hypothetical protein